MESKRIIVRRAAVGMAAALAVVATCIAGGPAGAAASADAASVDDTATSAAAVEQVLRDAGAVVTSGTAARAVSTTGSGREGSVGREGVPQTAASGATVSLARGLSIGSGAAALRITPVSSSGVGAEASLSPSGLAVYTDTAHSAFALSTARTGGNAGYAVITAADAPTEYRFAFTIGDAPARLELAPGGGVDVYGGAGALVNSIAPAWAIDAAGAAVPTAYAVEGNVLVQTVDHSGASYPVVADPRVRCDTLWCTLELSRVETRLMAAHALSPGIACRFLGPGAAVCAALLIGGWAQANVALATGQCVGVRIWKANFVSYPHLAYVRCYA
jgi:hypothetical protein